MLAQFVITAILSFLALVVVLVVLHELGHYLAGRYFGLIPKAFSVGMGPELTAFVDRHGTRWKIGALPIGGYVKFAGEMHPVKEREREVDEHDFSALARWKRAVIIAAGPAMNLVIAALIFLALALAYGKVEQSNVVETVESGSPAFSAGIRKGDKLVSWNGEQNPNMISFSRSIRMNPNSQFDVQFERSGKTFEANFSTQQKTVTDKFGNVYDVGYAGLGFPVTQKEIASIPEVIDVSVTETGRIFKLQLLAISQILTGQRSVDEISGPIRMAKMSAEQLSLGWIQLAYFAALISIAIAFMNLLPIPGLDGGYLAIYAFETIAQKDLSEMGMKKMIVCGYVILGCLMIFSFTNDIRVIFLQ